LTDGTAYLRAVMEADGNIRYANYQSQEQVIQFLTDNGFGPETYADWFPDGAEPEKAASSAPVFAPDFEQNRAAFTYSAESGLTEYLF
ncbi:MAG: hypothetical protein SXU28_14585, partial [Pseudomonadota bacterium]|nr:hypothetical protein [Pseudomonadota bacterium]